MPQETSQAPPEWTADDQQRFGEIFDVFAPDLKAKTLSDLKSYSRADREAAFSEAKKAKQEAKDEMEKDRQRQSRKRTSITPPVKSTIVVHFYPFAPESPIVAAAAAR